MRFIADPDVATFARHASDWLLGDPVRHNVMYTVVEARLGQPEPDAGDAARAADGPRWLRIQGDDDALHGAAIETPPYPLLLSVMPPAVARALAEHLREEALPGVNGPAGASDAFAVRRTELTGERATPGIFSRMYRLDAVTPPVGATGRLRPVTPEHRDLVVRWVAAFAAEATRGREPLDAAREVDSRMAAGDLLWLWEDGGEPVSFCWLSAPAGGVVRVSAVYTPPDLRGHGYASGCVAAVSQLVLDRGGRACMLFADLANPTSNKIYQRIGYQPVDEFHEWRFN